jgi:predicted nuclease with TOPRIM domain
MISYTALYGLFALVSIGLFNALILLSRYVKQTKRPPVDEEFEKLITEKNHLQNQYDHQNQEATSLQEKVQKLEAELQKAEENLKSKVQELESVNKAKAS